MRVRVGGAIPLYTFFETISNRCAQFLCKYALLPRCFFILLVFLLMPYTGALEFINLETQLQATSEEKEVLIQWTNTTQNYTLHLIQEDEIIDTTHTTEPLATISFQTGLFLLELTDQNTTITEEITVLAPQQESLGLKLSTDKQQYTVGENVLFTASANTAVATTLTIYADEQLVDMFSITLNGPLSYFYTVRQPGTYTAVLRAEQQSATIQFIVDAIPEFSIDFTLPQRIEQNRRATFNATVRGGTAPYTYLWLIEQGQDIIECSGSQQATCFFLEDGVWDVTLIVHDAQGVQKIATKQITVLPRTIQDIQERYALELIFTDRNTQLLQELRVTIQQGSEMHTEHTNELGSAFFSNLSAGTYRIRAYKEDTPLYETTYVLEGNSIELFRIDYPIREEEELFLTHQNVEQTLSQEQIVDEDEHQLELDEEIIHLQNEISEAVRFLNDKRRTIQRNENIGTVLDQFELIEVIDKAIQQIPQVTTIQELTDIMHVIPREIRIHQENNRILYPDLFSVEEQLLHYFEIQNITSARERRAYIQAIREELRNTTIQTRTFLATIRYEDREETHTFVQRTIQSGEQNRVVEFFPQGFFQGDGQLRTKTEMQPLDATTKEFMQKEYTYSVLGEKSQFAEILIIPQTVVQPFILTGFVAIDSNITIRFQHIFILISFGMLIGGFLVGKKIHQKKEQELLFTSFYELSEQLISRVHVQEINESQELFSSLKQIYATLDDSLQQETKDIMQDIDQEIKIKQFIHEVTRMETETLDINTLTSRYEGIIDLYESFSQERQEQLQRYISRMDALLPTQNI